MADESLMHKIHDLSDLELAVLLCLITREHCLISSPATACDDLVLELQLIATKTFGLDWTVIDCTPSTTLEDFASSLLSSPTRYHDSVNKSRDSGGGDSATSAQQDDHDQHGLTHPHPARKTTTPPPAMANLIIARNLDRAPHAVQIQALELLRTRRLFTRTAMQVAPKRFLFVPVLAAASGGRARVTRHLNDFFAMAHWHDPDDDGFLNLEQRRRRQPQHDDNHWTGTDDASDAASTASVVKRVPSARGRAGPALISEDDITCLRELGRNVRVDVDVLRYQMDIVSFLRMHRAVHDGITPSATRHLAHLARTLAPLHNLDLVSPALVALAARKVYLHRIRVVTDPDDERSVQWGSHPAAVADLLRGIGPEQVLDEVMAMVTAPV